MTPSTLFDHAATLNYNGVALMCNNDCGQAHKAFRDALDTMQTLAREAEPETDASSSAGNRNCIAGQAPVPCDQLQEERFRLYDHAFAICAEEGTGAVPSSVCLALSSAAILFNMGLMYHVKGLETFDNAKLEKALRLYTTCLSLMNAPDWVHRRDAKLLLVAALNNQVHIYSHLGQVETGKQTHAELCNLLPHLNELRAWSGDSRVLDEVILNMTLMTMETNTAAAA